MEPLKLEVDVLRPDFNLIVENKESFTREEVISYMKKSYNISISKSWKFFFHNREKFGENRSSLLKVLYDLRYKCMYELIKSDS